MSILFERYETLSHAETADGRPEWQVQKEMEQRVAVWLAQKAQAKLLVERRTERIRELSRIRHKRARLKLKQQLKETA